MLLSYCAIHHICGIQLFHFAILHSHTDSHGTVEYYSSYVYLSVTAGRLLVILYEMKVHIVLSK